MIVFFSTKSSNTKRFVERLNLPYIQIPLNTNEIDDIIIDRDFVLITPTYGGGYLKGSVPKQVIKFLNSSHNRNHLKGVISTGNRNFGSAFCLAGKIISEKCSVPNIASVELFGTKEQAEQVKKDILNLFKKEIE